MTNEESIVIEDRLRSFFFTRGVLGQNVEDMTQEVFLRVMKAEATGAEINNLEHYCIGYAKKLLYESYRRKKNGQKHDSIDDVNNNNIRMPAIFNDPYHKVYLNEVLNIIETIPNKEIFMERVEATVDGNTDSANVLSSKYGINTNTVDMRVFHIRKELKKKCTNSLHPKRIKPKSEGKKCPYVKIGGKYRLKILSLLAEKKSHRQIAKILGCSKSAVSGVFRKNNKKGKG